MDHLQGRVSARVLDCPRPPMCNLVINMSVFLCQSLQYTAAGHQLNKSSSRPLQMLASGGVPLEACMLAVQ